MRPYIVAPGDTLLSIVCRIGGDSDAVWNDAANADLRALRPDPAILNPGDVLYVPEKKPAFLPVKIGQTNRFEARRPTQTVRLILGGKELLAGSPYVIRGLGDEIKGTTGGDGALTVDVPVSSASFLLELTEQKVAHRVLVGHLDPARERTGVRQRLSNLGYGSAIAPLLAALGIDVELESGHAVRAFQAERGTPATGKLDADTIDAIHKAHGT